MPFGRMRRIGNCPPRLRAGLGELARSGTCWAWEVKRQRDRHFHATQVVHCPLPPSRGWSAAREGRGDAGVGAGGRGRRLEINAVLAAVGVEDLGELRRTIHTGSFWDFSRFVARPKRAYHFSVSKSYRGGKTGRTVSIEVSRFLAQRAGFDEWPRCQRVCQYYTPFLFFVKYFCIEKEQNAIRNLLYLSTEPFY